MSTAQIYATDFITSTTYRGPSFSPTPSEEEKLETDASSQHVFQKRQSITSAIESLHFLPHFCFCLCFFTKGSFSIMIVNPQFLKNRIDQLSKFEVNIFQFFGVWKQGFSFGATASAPPNSS